MCRYRFAKPSAGLPQDTDSLMAERPGVGPAAVSQVGGPGRTLDTGYPYGLLVSLALWMQRALRGGLGAASGGRHRAGAEPAGRRTRHFRLGWCSRVGPGPGSRVAPPGCGSSTGLSQKTPVAVTGRHLAALPGLSRAGAPSRLHAL